MFKCTGKTADIGLRGIRYSGCHIKMLLHDGFLGWNTFVVDTAVTVDHNRFNILAQQTKWLENM